MSGRFLFALWEGGGTGPPELALARRLVARGHDVTVLADPTLERDAAHSGASFVPWREAPHRATRTAESEIVKDWDALTPLSAFARARDRHAFRPAHLFAREVIDRFHAHPVDVVAVDAMLFGGLVGAEATGAPFAALIPMTSFLPAAGRPPPALGLMPAKGPLGALRDRVLYAAGDTLLWRTCLPLLNDARRSVGLEPIAHPLEQIRRADRILVQASAWFDFDAKPTEGNVRYVGPELADPVWVDPFEPPWPEGNQDPMILVAFSTTFMNQLPALREIVEALSSLSVRALVTVGPALDPRGLSAPRHVAVRASAPHAKLLPEAALMITHAGHGTVIRALASGVPLVCMPMGRDQSDNAARVVRAGAGLSLSPRAGARAIRHAVERVLRDPAFRAGAQHAKERIALEVDESCAVGELESLLAPSRQRQRSGEPRRDA